MGFWSWLRGGKDGPTGGGAKDDGGAARTMAPGVRWLSAEESPFGVRVLDIGGVTQNMLSTTTDPANAARAISWDTATDDALPAVKVGDDVAIARCSLSYPVAPKLPDGLLFAPSAMEEKWALFHRGGSVIAVRSWTAQVGAVARGAVAGDRLV